MDYCSTIQLDGSLLTQQIEELLSRLQPRVSPERRHDDRVTIAALFRLTPLNSHGEPVLDDAITVVGKDISRRGVSFFHEQQLTYRRAIVSLEHPDGQRFAVEVDINWCRFTRPGWYVSGGRLVRPVSSKPLASQRRPAENGWTELPLAGNSCC